MVLTPPLRLSPTSQYRIGVIASVTSVVILEALWSDREDKPPYMKRIGRVAHSAGDRTLETFEFPTSGGFLYGLLTSRPANTKRGQMYVEGQVGERGMFYSLFKGYADETRGLADGMFSDSGPGGGEGNIRSIQIANPAAGVEISATVPTNALWRFLSLRLTVVGGAANFVHSLQVTDGTNIKWQGKGITVTATATEIMNYTNPQEHLEASESYLQGPPSHDILPETYVIRTAGITPDDDYAVGELKVEEWLVI